LRAIAAASTIPVMYKVIVVGTDGSETASVAVREATTLASLTGATLHVVHAAQRRSPGVIAFAASGGVSELAAADKNKAIVAESRRICEQAATEARRLAVEVKLHAVPGEAADALIAVAEDVGADLLVVGNRGMSGARRFVLGSVPNAVSHHCPCSLLIVDTTSDDDAHSATAAVDVSRESTA
jgi:nucleotide-binding universal stress UspA family protein